jgi:fermentation-respiration switch protein FrsA (DUF1100 family)
MNFWRTRKRQIGLLLAAGVLISVMLRWFEHSQVYHPDRFLSATGAELDVRSKMSTSSPEDGLRLNGWFYPADVGSARASLVVLVCHGNGGNISHRLEMAQALLATGVNVFLFDYRGYGRSEGYPTEEGTYSDGQGGLPMAPAPRDLPTSDIILFGESLGGAIAAELATRMTCAGLILQSTFTRITDIGADLFPWLPVRWLNHIKYDTVGKLPLIKAPVLVMHSRL